MKIEQKEDLIEDDLQMSNFSLIISMLFVTIVMIFLFVIIIFF
jgi:hypothetical protein